MGLNPIRGRGIIPLKWMRDFPVNDRNDMKEYDESNSNLPARTEFLLYQTEDGRVRIETRMQGETVWLSQAQMAELFQTSVPNISMHVRNLFDERELLPGATVKDFLIAQTEGQRAVRRRVAHYNLDVIISVGYRVKSHRGTQFRIWATQRLREYIVKGFALDDERLKRGGGNYFDELLARIRDIRTSERNFYQKIKDLYTTSLDYDAQAEVTMDFFAMVQNKLHWAIHGHTAAELIAARADGGKPNMGLTTWSGAKVRRPDVHVAKNYLNRDEIELLNLIVSQYLDFAELQARTRKPMAMRDWARKLDDFLKVNDREILPGLGRVSAQLARETAEREFDRFDGKRRLEEDSAAEREFERELEQKARQLGTHRTKPDEGVGSPEKS